MGGAPGYIRQEFRELEILDFITKMRYEGHLPNSIDGHGSNTIIHQFQEWKGADYVPDQIHPAINGLRSILLNYRRLMVSCGIYQQTQKMV